MEAEPCSCVEVGSITRLCLPDYNEGEKKKTIFVQATIPARNQFPALQMHHMLTRLGVDGRGDCRVSWALETRHG